MLYRTSLAILSSGLIAIETFTVVVPLSVNTHVKAQDVLSWGADEQTDCQAAEVPTDSDEFLGMSSAGVMGTISLIKLVTALAALGCRITGVKEEEAVAYSTSTMW